MIAGNAIERHAHLPEYIQRFVQVSCVLDDVSGEADRFRREPVDNAFIESFNRIARDECLNDNWFLSLDHAKEIIEEWQYDYNHNRPHSALGGLTPVEFAAQFEKNFQLQVLQ